MIKYILNRLLLILPILLGVIFITFILLELIPGSAVTVLMQNKINNEAARRVEESYRLNDPVQKRFLDYCGLLIRGNLGDSIIMKQSVTSIILNALPRTIKLASFAIIFSWVFGILVGVISAVFKGSILDKLFMGISVFGISMPTFSIGILLQYLFAYKLKWLPISGANTWQHYVIPSVVLGWSMSGEIARLLRANLITTLRSPFITTAKAKGANKYTQVVHHSLKISLLPIITIMAVQLTSLLSGALITENIFGIPGIGTLSISALTNRDTPLIQGIILLSTTIIILGNLVADLIYAFVDPRVYSEYEED